MWEKGTVVPTLGGQLVPRAITKALMKVLPSAFLRHFMGGSTVFFPLAPKEGKNYTIRTPDRERTPSSSDLHWTYCSDLPDSYTIMYGQAAFTAHGRPWEQQLQQGLEAGLRPGTAAWDLAKFAAPALLKTADTSRALEFVCGPLDKFVTSYFGQEVVASPAPPARPAVGSTFTLGRRADTPQSSSAAGSSRGFFAAGSSNSLLESPASTPSHFSSQPQQFARDSPAPCHPDNYLGMGNNHSPQEQLHRLARSTGCDSAGYDFAVGGAAAGEQGGCLLANSMPGDGGNGGTAAAEAAAGWEAVYNPRSTATPPLPDVLPPPPSLARVAIRPPSSAQLSATASSHLQDFNETVVRVFNEAAVTQNAPLGPYVLVFTAPSCAHCSRMPTMEPAPSTSHTAAAAGGGPAGAAQNAVSMYRLEGGTHGMGHLYKKGTALNPKGPRTPATASFYCGDCGACKAAGEAAAVAAGRAGDLQLVQLPRRGPSPRLTPFGHMYTDMPAWLGYLDNMDVCFGPTREAAESATRVALLPALRGDLPFIPGCAQCKGTTVPFLTTATLAQPAPLCVCTTHLPAGNWLEGGGNIMAECGQHARPLCSCCTRTCGHLHGPGCGLAMHWDSATGQWQTVQPVPQ